MALGAEIELMNTQPFARPPSILPNKSKRAIDEENYGDMTRKNSSQIHESWLSKYLCCLSSTLWSFPFIDFRDI